MAYPLLPPNPSGFHYPIAIHSSRGRFILPRRVVDTSSSARRRRASKLRAAQSSGTGGTEPSQGGPNSNLGSAQPAFPSFSLSNLPGWATWLFGAIFFTAIPLYRRILVVEDQVEKTVDKVAAAVERAAEATEKAASDFADSLPEGQLKQIALKVEKMADVVDDTAEAAQAIVDKVDEVMDKVEEVVSPLIGEEVRKDEEEIKPNKAATASTEPKKAS